MIDNVEKLRVHLKMFKKQCEKQNVNEFSIYPNFCVYLDKNKDKYDLPKETILNEALDIFLG
ncbi:hypothetical protein Q0N71_29365 [Bacillus thuringiensis]|uniref:hypothetical protein n=1 Tax=Bacillus thuringiensis TaxID=1428 RepID=UPI0034587444